MYWTLIVKTESKGVLTSEITLILLGYTASRKCLGGGGG